MSKEISNWGLNFNRDLAIVEKLYVSVARSSVLNEPNTMKVFFQCIKDQDMTNMLPIFKKASGLYKQFTQVYSETVEVPEPKAPKKKRAKVVIVEDEDIPKPKVSNKKEIVVVPQHLDPSNDLESNEAIAEFYFNYDGYDLVRKVKFVKKYEDIMLGDTVDMFTMDFLTLDEIVGLKNYATAETKQTLLTNFKINLDNYNGFRPNKKAKGKYLDDLELIFVDKEISLADVYGFTEDELCNYTKIGTHQYRIDV